jgi:hypothetical protein
MISFSFRFVAFSDFSPCAISPAPARRRRHHAISCPAVSLFPSRNVLPKIEVLGQEENQK